jgi:N-acetylmuramoyl-L-alanine amidase
MKFSKKAALGSALTFAAMASLVGLGSSTPVTAGSAPISIDTNLLPQAALDAALAEETALPEAISLPSARNRFVSDSRPVRGGSLTEMVSSSHTSTPNSREEECLAVGVYFESKSESLVGQLAVADVILNRTQSGRFASSVCGVLTQPGQFSFVRGGRLPSVNRSSRDWQEALAIARIAQDNRADSGVGKALFFHATHVSPGWALTRVTTIGNHVFYR